MRLRHVVGFGVLLALNLSNLQAASVQITPVRLFLSAAQPTAVIELANTGATPVGVQIRAYRWWQENGEDKYEPTKDLFFAPPIVNIPESGRAIVRFRLRAKAPEKIEGSYRLYIQELPPPKSSKPEGSGMNFRFRFGVPVFVQPDERAVSQLKAELAVEPGSLKVALANVGAAHLKVEGVELFPTAVNREAPSAPVASAQNGSGGAKYLLPSNRQDWRLNVGDDVDLSAHVLLIRTDDRSGRSGSGLTRDGWLWLPLGESRPSGAATNSKP